MKRILFILVLFFSFANASITLKNVTFSDQEENASTYTITYYPKQDFINLGLTSTHAGYIISCRDEGTPTLKCGSDKGLTTADLTRIRENSYLVDWGLITNSMGLAVRDYNFLLALMGLAIGFTILFFMVNLSINLARGK